MLLAIAACDAVQLKTNAVDQLIKQKSNIHTYI